MLWAGFLAKALSYSPRLPVHSAVQKSPGSKFKGLRALELLNFELLNRVNRQ
jgi:hypothetical protein